SLKIKVDYAASKGLAGTMIWSSNMDYNGELLSLATGFGSGSAKKRSGAEGTADDVDNEAPQSQAPIAFN
ncbi:hypothetical protein H4R22_003944, partial [Coemansia sp. RSA 1290]